MPSSALLTQNPKATMAAALFSVFLCGAVAGALAMNFVDPHHVVLSAYPKNVELEKWRRELNLSDTQTRQLEVILDDFSKYYDNVLADGKTRVLQLLDDSQKRKFEQMLKNTHP